MKTIKQKESALTNHQTYFTDYGWNLVKAGTETDTTHYAGVNPLFQVFFFFFPPYPFAHGAPGQRANNCTWRHSKLKFKYDCGFSCERRQLMKQKAQVFAQTWKSKIKSQSTNDNCPEIQPKAQLTLDSASKLLRTDVLQLKVCLEELKVCFIQQLSHSKTTASSERCFAI